MARSLAEELGSDQKWKQLADMATDKADFGLALSCLQKANDFGGQLLLATASANQTMIKELANQSEESGKNNVSFLSHFITGDIDACLDLLIKTQR